MTLAPANSHASGYPLGLPGAVSPTRYVGGTATVAPTTGTFAVGDFVITADAKVFVCTVAGTPGTWVQAGGGSSGSTDYAQVTAPVSITATSEGTAQVIVTGASLAWDGVTAYLFQFFSPEWQDTVATASFNVVLFDGTAVVAYLRAGRAAQSNVPVGEMNGWYGFVPPVGTRAYSVRGWVSGISTVTVGAGAGAGSNDAPAFLRVTPR